MKIKICYSVNFKILKYLLKYDYDIIFSVKKSEITFE